jgi:hypothetical protein
MDFAALGQSSLRSALIWQSEVVGSAQSTSIRLLIAARPRNSVGSEFAFTERSAQ